MYGLPPIGCPLWAAPMVGPLWAEIVETPLVVSRFCFLRVRSLKLSSFINLRQKDLSYILSRGQVVGQSRAVPTVPGGLDGPKASLILAELGML